MRLNDPLVTSIEFEGKEHPIDLTFDNVLDVFDILEDSELFPEEKVNMALGLLLTNFDETSQGSADQQFLLFNYILENYISVGNTDVVETDRLGNPMPSAGKENRSINLVHDAKYIYASFRQIGINLFEEQGTFIMGRVPSIIREFIEVDVDGKGVTILNNNLDQLEGKSNKAGASIKELSHFLRPRQSCSGSF